MTSKNPRTAAKLIFCPRVEEKARLKEGQGLIAFLD
jgi:hypothetical protein